jgi:DNA-binding MarR family transcriptional regulator
LDRLRTIDALSGFGFLLKDVSRLYSRNFERHCARLGLTLARCRVLGHLQRHEGISQARLAELSDSDPMTLGRLLMRMQADGLVERRPDPRDGRAHSLYLLRKADPLLAEIWRLSDLARGEALAGLGADDRAQLMALLQHIRDNLEALTAGASDRGNGQPKTSATTPPVVRRGQRRVA